MKWPPSALNWPMADLSEKVASRGHTWHVQRAGRGPRVVLIHGAGGATQSWRGLFPILQKSNEVIAVDLPGQGFTRMGRRTRCGLVPMAEDLDAMLTEQEWQPEVIIGHSAGAAIALQMAMARPVPVVGINAALGHFKGVAGWLFPAMAKILALNPLTAPMITATMTKGAVERLLVGTGSKPDAEMRRLYHLLASDRAHVDATLSMIAQWRLDPLLDRLADIESPVTLVTGAKDLAVPPSVSEDAAKQLPDATVVAMAGLGHLMHEEAPELVIEALKPALAVA